MRITTPDPELCSLLLREYDRNDALRPSMLVAWISWLIRADSAKLKNYPSAFSALYKNVDYFRPLACFPLIEPYLVDRDWSEEELTARRVAYLLTKD